jgi:NAD(P)-dependent dehydrogenase (short-subunit alcohol dehydrogenase family)
MEYGLIGRRVLIARPDEPLGAACARALSAEGAVLIDSVEADPDVVVANGPVEPGASVLDVVSSDELHDAWDVVVESVDSYRQALPSMRTRGWGRLVWVGTGASRSLDGDGERPDELAAIVTLAMRAACKVAASEAGPDGVTANTVLAGGAATPDDVAATVAFLCSDGAGYITGVTITVDGGAGSGMF